MVCSRCGKEVTENTCAISTIEEYGAHVYFWLKKNIENKKLLCIDCGIEKLEEVLILKKLAGEERCNLCLERFENIGRDRCWRG